MWLLIEGHPSLPVIFRKMAKFDSATSKYGMLSDGVFSWHEIGDVSIVECKDKVHVRANVVSQYFFDLYCAFSMHHFSQTLNSRVNLMMPGPTKRNTIIITSRPERIDLKKSLRIDIFKDRTMIRASQ